MGMTTAIICEESVYRYIRFQKSFRGNTSILPDMANTGPVNVKAAMRTWTHAIRALLDLGLEWKSGN